MPDQFNVSAIGKKGQLIHDDPMSLQCWVSFLEDQRIVGTLQKWYKPRTSQQNKAWWGIMIPIFMRCYGTDNKDEAHHALCIFVGHCKTVTDIKGRPHDEPLPTHTLKTDEFSQLWEKCARKIAMEYGAVVPDPISEMAVI